MCAFMHGERASEVRIPASNSILKAFNVHRASLYSAHPHSLATTQFQRLTISQTSLGAGGTNSPILELRPEIKSRKENAHYLSGSADKKNKLKITEGEKESMVDFQMYFFLPVAVCVCVCVCNFSID